MCGLLLAGCSDATKNKAKDAAGAAGKSAGELNGVAGGQELMTKVNELFNSTKNTLQGITDVDSAKAALPKLEELKGSADSLSKSISTLPEGAKSTISGVVEKGITELKALVEKIEAIPGVSAVAKPTIDQLMEKLSALAMKKG